MNVPNHRSICFARAGLTVAAMFLAAGAIQMSCAAGRGARDVAVAAEQYIVQPTAEDARLRRAACSRALAFHDRASHKEEQAELTHDSAAAAFNSERDSGYAVQQQARRPDDAYYRGMVIASEQYFDSATLYANGGAAASSCTRTANGLSRISDLFVALVDYQMAADDFCLAYGEDPLKRYAAGQRLALAAARNEDDAIRLIAQSTGAPGYLRSYAATAYQGLRHGCASDV